MRSVRAWVVRFRNLLLKRSADREFARELQSHLDLHIADNMKAGMTPEDARRYALVALGGLEQAKEAHREFRGIRFLDDSLQDLRFAARLFVKNRGFALTAVLVLGLGIGASNTFFTIVDATCLRGLTLDQPSRVVDLSTLDKTGRERRMSFLDFEDLRASTTSFSDVAAFAPRNPVAMTLANDRQAPERFMGAYVSSNMFRAVGDRPVAGRDFAPEDDRPGAPAVVILGTSIWERLYNKDPLAVGQTVRVNGRPAVVVGVMPVRSKFPNNAQVWQPLSSMAAPGRQKRDDRVLSVLARLAVGRGFVEGRSEVERVAGRLSREHPDTNDGVRFRVVPIDDEYVATITDPAWLAFITVGVLVLIVACANVANLLLMHSLRRARELAVRGSLGATRSRIVRQLFAESVLLAAGGGFLGLLLTAAGTRLFWGFIPADAMPYWMSPTINLRAVAILTGLCLASALLFGISPALHVSKIEFGRALKDGSRTVHGGARTRRWSTAFLVAQCALGMLFLSIVVMARFSLLDQQGRDPEMDAPNLVTAAVVLSGQNYSSADERRAFYDEMTARLRALSEVSSVTIAATVPFGGAAPRRLSVEDRAPDANTKTLPVVWSVAIGTGYFETLELGMIRGRSFDDRDGSAGHENAVVNQRFVEMYFPHADPIGKLIRVSDEGATAASFPPSLTIVGVSPTIRQRDRPEVEPIVYLPFRSELPGAAVLIARGRSTHDRLASVLRREVSAIDPDLPLFRVMTLAQAIDEGRWNGRLSSVLATSISWTAIALAMVGLYAVMAYAVTQRTPEIGLRMALGAQPFLIAAATLRSAVTSLGLGLVLGAGCVFGFDRLFSTSRAAAAGSLRVTDPRVLLSAGGLLLGLSMVACLMPVVRALRIDPVKALRYE